MTDQHYRQLNPSSLRSEIFRWCGECGPQVTQPTTTKQRISIIMYPFDTIIKSK